MLKQILKQHRKIEIQDLRFILRYVKNIKQAALKCLIKFWTCAVELELIKSVANFNKFKKITKFLKLNRFKVKALVG